MTTSTKKAGYSTTATHKGKNVVVIRKGEKQCRICPINEYEKRAASDVRFSESCELVPTSELSNIKKVEQPKKKKAQKAA